MVAAIDAIGRREIACAADPFRSTGVIRLARGTAATSS
jgi:hypothetical protein